MCSYSRLISKSKILPQNERKHPVALCSGFTRQILFQLPQIEILLNILRHLPRQFQTFCRTKNFWFISLLLTGFKTWRRNFFLECSVPWPHVDCQTVAFLFGSQVKTSSEKIKRTRQLSSPLPQRRSRRRRRLAERQQQVGENGILATSVGTSHVVLPYSAALWCGACCLYTLGQIQPLFVIFYNVFFWSRVRSTGHWRKHNSCRVSCQVVVNKKKGCVPLPL